MDGHCLSPYTCKCCTVFKQFDRLNFDSLAGKHQKRQNFPLSKFSAIRYMHKIFKRLFCHYMKVKYTTILNNNISDNFLPLDNEMEL